MPRPFLVSIDTMPIYHRGLPLFAALLFTVACGGRDAERATTNRPAASAHRGAPVIVVSIDTLRADHLPAWGYGGVKTPALDRLTMDGVVYRNAYSHVPLTLPSHVSLLTGLLPAEHGVRDNIGYRFEGSKGGTLPGVLRTNGYETGAAVSAYVLRASTGMATLFDWYDDQMPFQGGVDLGAIQRPGIATVAAARTWFKPRASSPFFLFLHIFEPHAPYDPPEPYRSASATLYDGEIAHADAILADFFDDLRRSGVYDRALIIVLSDHGEGLNDHGEREHGIFVYRESIHVPLIMKLPESEGAGAVLDEPVGLVDVFPTVLSLVGLPPQPGLAGAALLGPQATGPAAPRRIFSESLYPRLHLGWSDLRSLIDDQHHYIDAPRAELYAWRDDPGEGANVLAEHRREAAALREDLTGRDKKIAAPSAASAEERAKLTALGYISAPSAQVSGPLPDPKDEIGQLAAYESAKEALARGDLLSAISGFRAMLDRNPNFTDAAIGLAHAYEASRRDLDAAEVYRDLLTRNPALTEQAAVGMATAFLNAGRFADARTHAELVLQSNPPAAHLLLGRIALARGAPEEAEEHARIAAADAHYAMQGTLLLSETLTSARPPKVDEALRILDALKRDRERRGEPSLATVEIARASALMRISRSEEAIQALEEAIRLQPRSRDAYRRLAAIHLLRRDISAAEAVFERMVLAEPSPASYAAAAETLHAFGQEKTASQWLRRGAPPR